MRTLARLGLGLLIVSVTVAALIGWSLRDILNDLPDVGTLRNYRPPVVSKVWSRDGVLMAELFDQRREVISPDQLPPYVVHAFLAAEDSSFFEHEGLDWQGILRAAWTNLKERKVVQGGSTITQQVAKSLLLTPERSLRRKAREAVLALRIEQNLSKQEILNLYLNQIYLGHGAYGVEAAAKVYFGTTGAKLSLQQAALLAGLPQAPSRYDPFQHPNKALERRRYVLERMADEGWIERDAGRRLINEPLGLVPLENPFYSTSPHYSEHVRRILEERYGREQLLQGGLSVVSAMDSTLQNVAQQALRSGLEALDQRQGYRGPLERVDADQVGQEPEQGLPIVGSRQRAVVMTVEETGLTALVGGRLVPMLREDLAWALPRGARVDQVFQRGDVVLCELLEAEGQLAARLVQEPEVEGAIICLDTRTGEVLACVGGYDFARSQFNRAIQAQRQVGSALKPLVYAAAIDRGYTPATLIYDTPIVYDSPERIDKWKPGNYSREFYGATTLREALVLSRNVITIKVLRDIGITYTVEYLRNLGVSSPLSADLSLALGAPSLTLLELVRTYAVLATGGVLREPAFVLRVEDRDRRQLESFSPPPGDPVMKPETAFVLTNMLKAVIKEGTGRRARGLAPAAAGKTGTTNENRDAWFVGYTPDLVTGVWVGFDDGRSLGKRETGGRAAAPIWLDFMQQATSNAATSEFAVPEGIEFARIDAQTGLLAGSNTKKSFSAAFIKGTVPEAAPLEEVIPTTLRPVDPTDPGALDMLR